MVILISSLITIIIVALMQNIRRRRSNLPPGPPPEFLVGNLSQLKPLWTESFSEWSQTYGPIISVWLGSQLAVVVSNSELAKQVLRDKDYLLCNRHRTARMTQNGSDLIWSDYGSHYVKLRKLCALELFSLKSIESFRTMREMEVRSMVKSIYNDVMSYDDRKQVVLRNYLGSVALNIVSRLVIGKVFDSKEAQEFKSIVDRETRLPGATKPLDYTIWLKRVSSWFSYDKGYMKHMARRKNWFKQVVMDEVYGGREQECFLQNLLVLKETNELSEDNVMGLVWNILTAGADTTAITIEWAMAELIRCPTVQERAQNELDSVVGSRRLMSDSDILKLPYLQCIVKETLRLHPPTPLMLPHKASDSVQIGGYNVTKGATIYVNVQAIGRDSANWSNPDEFRPHRFLMEETDIKGQDFRLLPFGSGRRVCPAAQLSINMITLALGNLLHCFSWTSSTLQGQIDMAERPGLVCYMKTPLQARASTRLPQEFYL